MAIEDTLVRIAVALEAIAAGSGLAIGQTVTVTPIEEAPEVEKPKRTRRKKATNPSTSKGSEPESTSTSEPETSEESPEPEVEIADVRTALTRLQTAVDGAAARKVLSTVGGNGALSKVKPAKYQAVIDAANAQAEEAEAA